MDYMWESRIPLDFGLCYEVDIGTDPLLRWGRMLGKEICRGKPIVMFWLSLSGLLDIP